MENFTFENRIPGEYFVTSGAGESDITVHAGSFDMALMEAGIHNLNIIMYSSILPPTAREIKRKELEFGSVAETIMAVANGEKGKTVTAGIIYGWVYKKGIKSGGLVAEYHDNGSEQDAEKTLRASLNGMFNARFGGQNCELKDIHLKIKSFVPKKKFGTSIVAIVFVNHKYKKIN